ncbi:MAG: hypothetical protein GX369_02185 [Euryarchaeota archaeon]|nr:hypothetical protein [Euryarchaeota archaeon]
MKRSTAIVAAIVVVAVIIVAAVGVMLLDSQGGLDSDRGSGATDGRPSGPEGTVNAAMINIGTNESNASAYDDLMEEFDETSDAIENPDALCQVAVTNNRSEEIKLNAANFSATLDNGNEVQALNTNIVTVESNTTIYLVLGFQTDNDMISKVNYKGDVDLEMPINGDNGEDLGTPKTMEAPENLTEMSDLEFESPDSWTITNGSISPMLLNFNDDENVVLALVVGTNNGSEEVKLEASDFWLDLGNDTWSQAEGNRNHNVVTTLQPDVSKAFLVGFRVNETVSPTAIQYWPDQNSNETVTIDIDPKQPSDSPSSVWIYKVWDEKNASEQNNQTSMNNQTGENQTQQSAQNDEYRLFVALNDSDNTSTSNINLKGWSEKQGLISANTTESNRTNGTAYVFELKKGDDINLLQYEDGGQTRYLWLRPLVLI